MYMTLYTTMIVLITLAAVMSIRTWRQAFDSPSRVKGSVYLHLLGLSIPLVIHTGAEPTPKVIRGGKCCDRYKSTKQYHSPACRKRRQKMLCENLNVI